MIAVAALEAVAGETVGKLMLERIEEPVDREDRVVRLIAGVDCGDLFVPNQDKGFGTEMAEEGVEDLGKLGFRELVEPGTADLCAVEQTLVGGLAHGVEFAVKLDRETEIVDGVLHGLNTDAGSKVGQTGEAERVFLQRLDVELVYRASGPCAAVTELLLIPEELGVASEGGGIGVLTILHGGCSFLYWRQSRGINNKSRQS